MSYYKKWEKIWYELRKRSVTGFHQCLILRRSRVTFLSIFLIQHGAGIHVLSMSIKKCMFYFILLCYLPILGVNKQLLQKIHLTSLLMLKMLWKKTPKNINFQIKVAIFFLDFGENKEFGSFTNILENIHQKNHS